MCGRFARYTPISELAWRYFDLKLEGVPDTGRYNISPGVEIEAFRAAEEGGSVFQPMYWGFRHHRVMDGPTPINARAETIATSPYFRDAFAHRRCLIPADGWYEWQATGNGKQPYYVTLAEDAPQDVLFLAGIWEPMAVDDACCAIITEPAAQPLAHIHERQPLVLDADCRHDWLDPALTDRAAIRQHTRRLAPEALRAWPISTRVNRPFEDDADLLNAIG